MGKIINFGWLPSLPDIRDFSVHSKKLGKLDPILSSIGGQEPVSVDLREWFSPIEDQKSLGSCTSMAGVALLEYFEKRAMGYHIDASKLFLYKTTRNLLGWAGDTGAYMRTTMGAMALLGVPPEKYWEYNVSKFDEEPPTFVYALAQRYRPTVYFRFDTSGVNREDLLTTIKAFLYAGWPSMFGFTVYDSMSQAWNTGEIPFPNTNDKVRGGHAICAAGFDDKKVIEHTETGEITVGAFLIRNSWSIRWGQNGYGWLPYDYLLSGLAQDWWSIFSAEYVDSGKFGI